jgi:hypothetical protein
LTVPEEQTFRTQPGLAICAGHSKRLDTGRGCDHKVLELEIDRLVVEECHVNDPTRLGKTVIRAVQLMKHAAYGKDGWLHMIPLQLCDSTFGFR